MTRTTRSTAALTLACLLLAGCRVAEHKDGNNKDVSIDTPFGSTSIKTSNDADPAAIGLTPYPGAVAVKDNDGDNSNADVNLNFGAFHLGVKAASLQTTDQPEKVLAFYRKDLARYGDVIECQGDTAVGQPTHTAQGLTCDTKQHNHITTKDHTDNGLELRAGSQQHQHIVSVEHKDGGTKIGLVLLELPTHLDDKSKQPE